VFRFLLIFTLCSTSTPTRADTQLTPWIFDLQKQFNTCINTPADNIYQSCQGVLTSSYTLRREIGYALDTCQNSNVQGCVAAFNNAGFPAETLQISTLKRCTMLENLNEVDLREIPENSCIEQIARNIEQNGIPSAHNTDISCGINYIECAEIVAKGTDYWKSAVFLTHLEKLQAIPTSDDFENDATTSHRYYSLLEREYALQIDLAQTRCSILTVIPHWANTMDYEGCMGETYADIWVKLNADSE